MALDQVPGQVEARVQVAARVQAAKALDQVAKVPALLPGLVVARVQVAKVRAPVAIDRVAAEEVVEVEHSCRCFQKTLHHRRSSTVALRIQPLFHR